LGCKLVLAATLGIVGGLGPGMAPALAANTNFLHARGPPARVTRSGAVPTTTDRRCRQQRAHRSSDHDS
jgi:hypothetical protein